MIAGQEVIFEPPDFVQIYREVCKKIILRIKIQFSGACQKLCNDVPENFNIIKI